jgi:hypothetical protein
MNLKTNKRKHEAEGRIFHATHANGCNPVGCSGYGCLTLWFVLFLTPFTGSGGLLQGLLIMLTVVAILKLIAHFSVPSRDTLVLMPDKLVWVENGLHGESPWANLITLRGGDDTLHIGLREPVSAQKGLIHQPVQSISLAHYTGRRDPFFFRRTLLGEALYHQAPQIFAELEEREKTMGFMHQFQAAKP